MQVSLRSCVLGICKNIQSKVDNLSGFSQKTYHYNLVPDKQND